MGPVTLLDEVGLAVASKAGAVRHQHFGARLEPAPVLQRMLDDGRQGRKNGRGFYRYEKGEYATVALAWDEARRTLRIGAREGGFPGMTGQRTLNVQLMPARPGERVQTKTVRFRGEPVELHFTP